MTFALFNSKESHDNLGGFSHSCASWPNLKIPRVNKITGPPTYDTYMYRITPQRKPMSWQFLHTVFVPRFRNLQLLRHLVVHCAHAVIPRGLVISTFQIFCNLLLWWRYDENLETLFTLISLLWVQDKLALDRKLYHTDWNVKYFV